MDKRGFYTCVFFLHGEFLFLTLRLKKAYYFLIMKNIFAS